MDEILASIRRIIENGEDDPVTSAGPAESRKNGSAEVERIAGEGEGDGVLVARISAAKPDAHLSAVEPSDPIAASAPLSASAPEKAETSVDELGEDAGLRAEDDIDWSALSAALAEEAGEAIENEASERTVAAENRSTHDRQETIPSGERAPPAPSADAPFVAANSDSRRMQEFRSAILDDAGAPVTDLPLLSSRAGDLVGASFEELAEAIRDGHMRSMEEMAQELLRPMLQGWLDDNLPRLVERLVREEIERVARGGRR